MKGRVNRSRRSCNSLAGESFDIVIPAIHQEILLKDLQGKIAISMGDSHF